MTNTKAHTLTGIEKVRFDCRVATLTNEMVCEGWDRSTAKAIAKEFARAGA